jgi:hypothetical protein
LLFRLAAGKLHANDGSERLRAQAVVMWILETKNKRDYFKEKN